MSETASLADDLHHSSTPWGPPPAGPIEIVPAWDVDVPFVPDMSREARKAFRKALAAAQGEYETVTRSKEVSISPRPKDGYQAPAYKFKYAELADVIAATKALAKHGISVSQPVVEEASTKKLWLYTILAHAEGGGQVTRLSLMGGADMKTFGGEITYLRRYCFAPAVGIASEDDADDNGDGGGGGDDGGYRREREEPVSAPAPSVQRRSASAAPKPTGQAAEAPAAPKKALPGAVKNLQTKIAALALPDDEYLAMLEALGVPMVGPDMLNDDWVKVKAEVDRRMAG